MELRMSWCGREEWVIAEGRVSSHRVAALGVEGCKRKYQNGQTGTQCGGIYNEKHGKGTKREEWSGSRAGVKRMAFYGLTKGLVIRNMRRGGMLIMEENDQGEHRWWSCREVWGRESREAADDV